MEHQKNKICNNEVDYNRNLYVYYSAILNLSFINPTLYISDIFDKIKKSYIENNYIQFNKVISVGSKSSLPYKSSKTRGFTIRGFCCPNSPLSKR